MKQTMTFNSDAKMAKDKFSRTKACATKTLYAVMKEMSRGDRGTVLLLPQDDNQ